MKKIIQKIKNLSNLKKVIILIIILIFLGGILSLVNKKIGLKEEKTEKISPQIKEILILPDGWSIIAERDGVELKIEKESERMIKPTIVLIKSTKKEANNDLYLEKIIQGAKYAIPSLQITTNQPADQDGFYIRNLRGFYYNGRYQVNLKQRLVIKNNEVWTLTASYDPKEKLLEKEIEKIFDSVYQAKILNSSQF